jgi:hypothetical protein
MKPLGPGLEAPQIFDYPCALTIRCATLTPMPSLLVVLLMPTPCFRSLRIAANRFLIKFKRGTASSG